MNCRSASHLMSLTVQSFLKPSSLLGSDSLNRERIGKDKAIPLTEQKKKAGFFQKVGAVQALMSKWEVAIALQMNWTWRLPLVFDWKLWKSPSFGGLSWIVFLCFLPDEGRQAGSKRNAEMRTRKSYTSPLCSGLSGRNLWVVLKEGLIWALCEI